MTPFPQNDDEQVLVVAPADDVASIASHAGSVEVIEEPTERDAEGNADLEQPLWHADVAAPPMSKMQKGVLVVVAVLIALSVAYLVKFWFF